MLFTLILAIFILTFYLWQRQIYNYWRKRKIAYIKPKFLVGNFGEMCTLKHSIGTQLESLYNTKSFEDAAVIGIYSLLRPVLLIKDVNLIKKIMMKDFNNFINRIAGADPHQDPLASNNLFFIQIPYWRELRQKLSPVFTRYKIKQMYHPLMIEIAEELESYLATLTDGTVVEIKDICRRFTSELIGSIAFGIRSNSFYNRDNEFYLHSLDIFSLNLSRAFSFLIAFAAPKLATLLQTKIFTKSTTDFMRKSIKHVMTVRESDGIVRNDLIDILIEMKREAAADPRHKHPSKNFDYIVAQAMLFQTAGFETSSSTMSFALYQLAKHPHMQTRLRAEIAEYMQANSNSIAYETIQEMPYLSMIIDETLRMYPIVSFLEREYSHADGRNYVLQDDVELTPGTGVYVSVLGIHYDEQYWPEPNVFDPERFAPKNRSKMNKDAYMPFGIGPRNCLGMRLGLLQTKLGLVHLLRNHEVQCCAQTPEFIEFCPKVPVLTHKTALYMKLKRN